MRRAFFVEFAVRLGVRAVREAGAFAFGPGRTVTITCADVNGRRLDVAVQRLERGGVSALHVGFWTGTGDEGAGLVNEQIGLAYVPCRFGGSRALFICPDCRCARAALFLPPGANRFSCRSCHGLTYEGRARHREKRYEAVVRPHRVLQRVARKLARTRSPLRRDALASVAVGAHAAIDAHFDALRHGSGAI